LHPLARIPALLLFAVLLANVAAAQPKTDIVVLANGDRITGEISSLERGRLEYKTDDIGTLQVEWDNVARLEAVGMFEVVTKDGRRFLGRLAPAIMTRMLLITDGAQMVALPMDEATEIWPIASGFWKKLDGSFDAGFNYTQSSGVAQLNVNSVTAYRRPSFEGRLLVSLTATEKEEGSRDDRGAIEAAYIRSRWPRWYVGGFARFESNESLGLELRSQLAGMVGPRLLNTNRAKLAIAGGLSVNKERGVDTGTTQNVEGLILLETSYFTYDRPRTELDLAVRYYPGLSDTGRRRMQLDARVKREVWKDFFISLSGYNSYDSRPPNPAFDTNDVGIVFSVGWSY
jgi:hypothetical protein